MTLNFLRIIVINFVRVNKDGLIDEQYFEKAVKRSLMLKARLGLLSTDRKLYANGDLDLDCPQYRKHLMIWLVNLLFY